MNRSILVRVCTFVVLLVSAAAAETRNKDPQAVTIPLDQIWAYNMPGTREIKESAKEADTMLLEPIFESWHTRADRLKYKDVARPGFAVPGSGVAALRAAHAVFVEGAMPRKNFSPDKEITIVFFSELAGGRFQIRQIERKFDHIEIRYQLEPGIVQSGRINLALIPLGKLPIGEYHVEMRQLPREQKFIEWGIKPLDLEWSRRFLCKPFSFTVTKKAD